MRPIYSKGIDLLILSTVAYQEGDTKKAARLFQEANAAVDIEEGILGIERLNTEALEAQSEEESAEWEDAEETGAEESEEADTEDAASDTDPFESELADLQEEEKAFALEDEKVDELLQRSERVQRNLTNRL